MPTHYQLVRARGSALAALGSEVGVTRDSFLWLFREPDFRLRKKIIQAYTRADQIAKEDLRTMFWAMLTSSTIGAFLGQALWRLIHQ